MIKLKILGAALFGIISLTGALAQPADVAVSKPQAVQTVDTGWQSVCRPSSRERNKLACNVAYDVVTSRERSRVLSIEILRQDAIVSLMVWTPLGVSLKSSINIAINGKDTLNAAFQYCQQNGCLARIDLPHKVLDSVRTAKDLSFEYADVQGAKIKTSVSMSGFSLAAAKSDL